MILFFTIMGLLFISLYQVKKKEVTSPIFVFSLLWMIVLFLYSLRLYGIYDISINTELILFLGIYSFLMGAIFFNHVIIIPKSYIIENKICYKKITIIFIVIFGLSLDFYIPNIMMVFQGTAVNTIKMMLVTGDISLGGPIMQYIVRPFTYIIIATASYCLFYDRKRKLLILLGVIFVLMEFFGAGSKTIILYTASTLALPLFDKAQIYYRRNDIGKRIIIVALLVFMFLFMGSRSLYFYISGCIPMFDKVINTTFYMPDGFSFGYVSFNSVIRFVIHIISILGIDINSSLFDQANKYINLFEYTTKVSDYGNYNAFHTFLGDFYVDLGIFGVILFSFIFGILSMYIYKIYKKTNISLLGHILYCIILYYLVFSIVRFQMSNTFLGLMLLYSLLILKFIIYPTKIRIGKLVL